MQLSFCTPLMIAVSLFVLIRNSEIVLHYSWYRGIPYDYAVTSKVPIGTICVSCCILSKFS